MSLLNIGTGVYITQYSMNDGVFCFLYIKDKTGSYLLVRANELHCMSAFSKEWALEQDLIMKMYIHT